MQKLTEDQKQNIIRLLTEHGISYAQCPMCHNNQFSVLDGYFSHTLQSDYKNILLGGLVVPSIGICCTKCGFISQHALGVLGLIPKEEVVK